MCGRDGTNVSCAIAQRACNSNYSDFYVSTRAVPHAFFFLQRELPDPKAKKIPFSPIRNSARNVHVLRK